MTIHGLILTFPLNLNFSLSKRIYLKLLLLISFLILSLLVFYLIQLERLTREGYLIERYHQEIKEISEQNLVLEKEYNQLFSLENVENAIKNLNFVKVSEVKYIPIPFDYLVKGFVQNYKAEPQ